ncbi:hypothetical protein [Isoptericola sp. NPDC057391]|uniref:hypothetical protein n=1 Tax=Isoptericola sp. NPDC057391 TaxID=3346117 RepID=UPI00362F4BBB
MSTTKMKNTTADKFEQHAAAASAARAEAVAAVEQLTTARESLSGMKSSAMAGNATLTPEALAAAHAAVELAELRAIGADKRAATAHAAAPFRPILAETVAGALNDVLGIPTTAVATVPTDGEVPHLYVVQPKPATRATWGQGYSGKVSVTYKRTGLHRELSVDEFADALQKRGISVAAGATSANMSVTLQPTVPYIAEVAAGPNKRIAEDLAGRLRGGYARGGKVESVTTNGDLRTATAVLTFETSELFGGVEDLLHQPTSAGRVVAVDLLSSGFHRDPVPLPNGQTGVTPEYHKVTVRVTVESTTTRYEHVVAAPAYEPVFTAEIQHAA